ncbi:hypothetical protein N7475_005262 [Penicillium sp. IBT 31633x]|nr:hypothetical protein N7475_005262 [Penicillium sp. IBT 31633x]
MIVPDNEKPATVLEGEPIALTSAPPVHGPAESSPEHSATQPAGPVLHGTFVYGPLSLSSQPGFPSCDTLLLGPWSPHAQILLQPALNTNCTNQSTFMPPSLPPCDSNEFQENKSRPCHIAHGKYMNWIQTVYYSLNSPTAFVQAWQQALKEMVEAFGHPQLPTIYILNQFLAAVSANPTSIPWIESLQFETGSLPSSIMDEAFADFLEFEADRLSKLGISIYDAHYAEMGFQQYCPFHQRLTRHHIEECYRNPRNMRRKRKWRRKQAQMAAAMQAGQVRL